MEGVFLFFSALADPVILPAIMFGVCVWIVAIHETKAIATFAAAMMTGVLLAYFIKFALMLPRPEYSLRLMAVGPAFPSAHALLGTVCYGFIGYYLIHYGRTLWTRVLGFATATVVPCMIGISRVYLGVHWASDVIAGWLIGVLVLAGFVSHLHHAQKRLNKADLMLIRNEHGLLYVIITVEALLVFLYWGILVR